MGANLRKMREAHKILAEYRYKPARIERGYTGRWLHVDVGKGKFKANKTTEQMKDLFSDRKRV